MANLMISVIVLAIISQYVSTCESAGNSDSLDVIIEDRFAKWKDSFNSLFYEPKSIMQMDSYVTMLYEMDEYSRTKEFQDKIKQIDVDTPDPTLYRFYLLDNQFVRADIGVTRVRDEGMIQNMLATFSYNSHGCFAYNFKYLQQLADYFFQPSIKRIIETNIENLRDLCWYRIKDMMVNMAALVSSTSKYNIDILLRGMKLYATSVDVRNYLEIAPRYIAKFLYQKTPNLRTIDGSLENQYKEQVLEHCIKYASIMDPAYKIFSDTKARSGLSYNIIQDHEFVSLIDKSEFCNLILNQVTTDMVNNQYLIERRENSN